MKLTGRNEKPVPFVSLPVPPARHVAIYDIPLLFSVHGDSYFV